MTVPVVVMPTLSQTDRQDIHSGVLAMLNLFTATYATDPRFGVGGIQRVNYHALPRLRTGEGPFVYLSDITETVHHDSGTRTTTFKGSFGYVDTLVNPEDTDDRVNAWADFMRDVCTVNARMLPVGIFQEVGLHEAEMPEGGPADLTNVLLEWEFVIQEGRL